MTDLSHETIEHIAAEIGKFAAGMIQNEQRAENAGLEPILGDGDDAVCYRANETGFPVILNVLRAAAAKDYTSAATFKRFFDEQLSQIDSETLVVLPLCSQTMKACSSAFTEMLEELDIEYRAIRQFNMPNVGNCQELRIPTQKVRLPLEILFRIFSRF